MEDHNKKSFFDDIEEDGFQKSLTSENSSYADEIATKIAEDISKLVEEGSKSITFMELTSVESYLKRGFIKDGELVKDPEQLLTEGLDVETESSNVETEKGLIKIYKTPEGACDCGTYESSIEEGHSFEELEKELRHAIACNEKRFNNNEKVIIYAFIAFKDAEVSFLKECYEFRGCFEFINAYRGWTLLKYKRVVRLAAE